MQQSFKLNKIKIIQEVTENQREHKPSIDKVKTIIYPDLKKERSLNTQGNIELNKTQVKNQISNY